MNRHWREKRQCLSPAFFFVLEKAVKSVGTAVIPTSLTRWSHGLQHLRRKRPRLLSQVKAGTHSAFGERSHTAAYTPKQGAFRMGALLLPSERSARSRTSPGRVSERQTLPLLGLGWVCSQRTQKASRLSKGLICRFLRLPSSTPCAVTFSANTQISLSAISVANTFALWYDKS